jgi:hypothetical protein
MVLEMAQRMGVAPKARGARSFGKMVALSGAKGARDGDGCKLCPTGRVVKSDRSS